MVKNSVANFKSQKACWMDGWMGGWKLDGWMDGWESGFKDCLQQSKIFYETLRKGNFPI